MFFLPNAPIPSRPGDHWKADGKAVTTSKPRLQQAWSNGGILSPLVRLVQDPLGMATYVLGARQSGPTEQEAEMARVANRKRICHHRLKNATTYEQWHASASELDFLEENETWKSESDSADFDAPLVEARLKQLDEARLSCDVGRMLFLIRTSLSRGLGDMDHARLYQHSYTGTKYLIERYISSALETLDTMLDVSAKMGDEGPDPRYILDQVLSARQAFGRSALLLSGGATFGMSHIGVLKTLWEARLLPRIISGASAGSIVCAVLCTRTDEELPEILDNFCYGDLAVFEKEGDEDSPLRRIGRFLKIGALIDISHLTRVMRDLLGDMTFQEGYNRTRRILNICVSSASIYELPRLLNYITAPNVIIWSAVAASCSVPFVFTPASLLAKDPKTGEAIPWNPTPQRYIDGSVDNDLPMTRLAEMFNVNHFIVSQVNPHVVPFLLRDDQQILSPATSSSSPPSKPPSKPPSTSYMHTLAALAKNEALHRLHLLAELGILPNAVTKLRSVLSQKYSGDITILPAIRYADFPRALKNPTPAFMLQAMRCGERATWSQLSRVRNHCAIELALDRAVQCLRARVVFSGPAAPARVRGAAGRQLKLSASLGRLRNGGGEQGEGDADGAVGIGQNNNRKDNFFTDLNGSSKRRRHHHSHPRPHHQHDHGALLRPSVPNVPNGHYHGNTIPSSSSSLPTPSSFLSNYLTAAPLDVNHKNSNDNSNHTNTNTSLAHMHMRMPPPSSPLENHHHHHHFNVNHNHHYFNANQNQVHNKLTTIRPLKPKHSSTSTSASALIGAGGVGAGTGVGVGVGAPSSTSPSPFTSTNANATATANTSTSLPTNSPTSTDTSTKTPTFTDTNTDTNSVQRTKPQHIESQRVDDHEQNEKNEKNEKSDSEAQGERERGERERERGEGERKGEVEEPSDV
ncbi:MAG: hypothetical protein M1819_003001 [Sarea resinae]|nr:MAG: hypothetical protein M1819_003001 [Sarea resinae]